MKALAKLDEKEARRLERFGSALGDKLDRPDDMLQALDGEWITVLSKVLDAVVSRETRRERLNCATCDPADFPVLLAVIQAVAYGAPALMWTPKSAAGDFVGLVDDDSVYTAGGKKLPPPSEHIAIAEKTWYRPQLAMLVTSIWPKGLSLAYYGATLQHILNAEEFGQDDTIEGDTIGETPSDHGTDKAG